MKVLWDANTDPMQDPVNQGKGAPPEGPPQGLLGGPEAKIGAQRNDLMGKARAALLDPNEAGRLFPGGPRIGPQVLAPIGQAARGVGRFLLPASNTEAATMAGTGMLPAVGQGVAAAKPALRVLADPMAQAAQRILGAGVGRATGAATQGQDNPAGQGARAGLLQGAVEGALGGARFLASYPLWRAFDVAPKASMLTTWLKDKIPAWKGMESGERGLTNIVAGTGEQKLSNWFGNEIESLKKTIGADRAVPVPSHLRDWLNASPGTSLPGRMETARRIMQDEAGRPGTVTEQTSTMPLGSLLSELRRLSKDARNAGAREQYRALGFDLRDLSKQAHEEFGQIIDKIAPGEGARWSYIRDTYGKGMGAIDFFRESGALVPSGAGGAKLDLSKAQAALLEKEPDLIRQGQQELSQMIRTTPPGVLPGLSRPGGDVAPLGAADRPSSFYLHIPMTGIGKRMTPTVRRAIPPAPGPRVLGGEAAQRLLAPREEEQQ